MPGVVKLLRGGPKRALRSARAGQVERRFCDAGAIVDTVDGDPPPTILLSQLLKSRRASDPQVVADDLAAAGMDES